MVKQKDWEQEKLIKEIAKIIDKEKYNPLIISRNYDKYLENILILLCEEYVKLEVNRTR